MRLAVNNFIIAHQNSVVDRSGNLADAAAGLILGRRAALDDRGGKLPAVFFVTRPEQVVAGEHVARLEHGAVHQAAGLCHVVDAGVAAVVAVRIAGGCARTQDEGLLDGGDGDGRINHGEFKVDLPVFPRFGPLPDECGKRFLIKGAAFHAFYKIKPLVAQVGAGGEFLFGQADVDHIERIRGGIHLELLHGKRRICGRRIKLGGHFGDKAFHILGHGGVGEREAAAVCRDVGKLRLQRFKIALAAECHRFGKYGIGVKGDVEMGLIVSIGMHSVRDAEGNVAHECLLRILQSSCGLAGRHARNVDTFHGDAGVERAGIDDALAQFFVAVRADLEKEQNTAHNKHRGKRNDGDRDRLFLVGRRLFRGCSFSHFTGYLISINIVEHTLSKRHAACRSMLYYKRAAGKM